MVNYHLKRLAKRGVFVYNRKGRYCLCVKGRAKYITWAVRGERDPFQPVLTSFLPCPYCEPCYCQDAINNLKSELRKTMPYEDNWYIEVRGPV